MKPARGTVGGGRCLRHMPRPARMPEAMSAGSAPVQRGHRSMAGLAWVMPGLGRCAAHRKRPDGKAPVNMATTAPTMAAVDMDGTADRQ